MKIGYLGAGAWGFCLASLLAENGHEVILWAKEASQIWHLEKGLPHPKLSSYKAPKQLKFTTDLKKAVEGADLIVESVTSQGFRPVLTQLKALQIPLPSLVITSKGIEKANGVFAF